MAPCRAPSLLACREGVSEPGSAPARRPPRPALLFLALTAVIGGADPWVAVEAFGGDPRAWCAQWLCLPHGLPSHDRFGRVWALLAPEPWATGFAQWVRTLHGLRPGPVVARDGQTARRAHDRRHDRSALHTVSAYACQRRLVLAQTAVAAKSNAIRSRRGPRCWP